jgi:Protein of unknown function (DUF1559)
VYLRRAVLPILAVLGILSCALLFMQRVHMQRVRTPDPRTEAIVNLKQIAMAMHEYHDFYGALPPAVIRDDNGQPLYSWRVRLLPFIEQWQLYNRLKLNEPWDSPHNKPLLENTPAPYHNPRANNPRGTTPYRVFIGPGTPFERSGITLKDFPDGLENTILVVEAREPVPWAKPDELVYDPKRQLPSLGAGRPDSPWFLACFADCSARALPLTLDEPTIRALVTRNGGEPIDPAKLN